MLLHIRDEEAQNPLALNRPTEATGWIASAGSRSRGSRLHLGGQTQGGRRARAPGRETGSDRGRLSPSGGCLMAHGRCSMIAAIRARARPRGDPPLALTHTRRRGGHEQYTRVARSFGDVSDDGPGGRPRLDCVKKPDRGGHSARRRLRPLAQLRCSSSFTVRAGSCSRRSFQKTRCGLSNETKEMVMPGTVRAPLQERLSSGRREPPARPSRLRSPQSTPVAGR
jgi:hypothetical protein